jgi:DNA-binding transcriptional LysR family regulator
MECVVEISWLEDYLALRDLGSFTAAAERRNTSQPAFSRRIQALETWLGVTLVDRSSRPPSFTPVAVENDAEIRSLLSHFHDLKGRLRGEQQHASRIRMAVQHSLSISLFPQLTGRVGAGHKNPVYWLHCGQRTECVEMMFRGEVDLLICHETQKVPAALPTTVATRQLLGRDVMVLAGVPSLVKRFKEPRKRGLPLLTYPRPNFFGQVIWDRLMPELSSAFDLETICVSAFSVALKQMALAGVGLAWLPRSWIADEIAAGSLAVFGADRFQCDLDIAIYMRASDVSEAQTLAWKALFGERGGGVQ